jgi:hypothetical protein
VLTLIITVENTVTLSTIGHIELVTAILGELKKGSLEALNILVCFKKRGLKSFTPGLADGQRSLLSREGQHSLLCRAKIYKAK